MKKEKKLIKEISALIDIDNFLIRTKARKQIKKAKKEKNKTKINNACIQYFNKGEFQKKILNKMSISHLISIKHYEKSKGILGKKGIYR